MSSLCLAAFLLTVALITSFEVKLKNSIMAHRGVWGYFPEHAIDGFSTAYYMGADYLETDISLTKDGELVIFHDSYLDTVTDINKYEQFQNRRRNDTVDGNFLVNKLFISDFTWEEVKSLFITQRYSTRPQNLNQKYRVILLEDLIKMTIELNSKLNKSVGIYIEPKSPEFFNRVLKKDLNRMIYDLLQKYGLHDKNSPTFHLCPIVIQSFEFDTIRYFKHISNLPLIYLMRWSQQYNLTEAAKYADGVGPDLQFVYYERVDDLLLSEGVKYNSSLEFQDKVCKNRPNETWQVLGEKFINKTDNKFVDFAHRLGLVVHPWQMANDQPRISDDSILEYVKLSSLGVDGYFTDFCDAGVFSMSHLDKLVYDFGRPRKNSFNLK